MKIQLLRGVVVNGKACRPGEVVDASDKQARYLLGCGKAVEHVSEAQPINDQPATKGRKKKES